MMITVLVVMVLRYGDGESGCDDECGGVQVVCRRSDCGGGGGGKMAEYAVP